MAKTYFQNPKNLQELKRQYKDLAKKHHPDVGGCNKIMAQINLEYEKLFVILQQQSEYTVEQNENINTFKDVINNIIRLNINIEICGTWIWVGGETKPVKDDLKQAGFKWARKKKMWYWRPEGYVKRGRTIWEMEKIRETFGSQQIKEQEKVLQIA